MSVHFVVKSILQNAKRLEKEKQALTINSKLGQLTLNKANKMQIPIPKTIKPVFISQNQF